MDYVKTGIKVIERELLSKNSAQEQPELGSVQRNLFPFSILAVTGGRGSHLCLARKVVFSQGWVRRVGTEWREWGKVHVFHHRVPSVTLGLFLFIPTGTAGISACVDSPIRMRTLPEPRISNADVLPVPPLPSVHCGLWLPLPAPTSPWLEILWPSGHSLGLQFWADSHPSAALCLPLLLSPSTNLWDWLFCAHKKSRETTTPPASPCPTCCATSCFSPRARRGGGHSQTFLSVQRGGEK